MARIRSIKPGFCTSVSIAALSIPARLHFAMLWTYADDAGRGLDNPLLIKAALWPLDVDVDSEQIEVWQAELDDHDRIHRYEVDGKRYFEVVNFTEHQKPNRPADSLLPQCPCSEDAVSGTGGDTAVVGEGEGKRSALPPKDFVVTDEMRAWLAEKNPGVDSNAETEAWIDWAHSKGRTYKNLVAGWRVWMRRAKPSSPRFGKPEVPYRGPGELARCSGCGSLELDCVCGVELADLRAIKGLVG